MRFADMKEYVHKHREELYDRGAARACGCVFHPGQTCPRQWQEPDSVPFGQRPLTLAIAGTPCLPFTSLGLRQGLTHDAMESWYLWAQEMEQAAFDVTLLENSDKFPKQLLRDALGKRSCLKFATFGSEELGWPVRRLRTYGVALHAENVVWIGPAVEDVTEDFLSWFGRSCALDGDAFVGLDSDEGYDAHLKVLAGNRGIYPSPEQLTSLRNDWTRLLPIAALETFEAASAEYSNGTGAKVGLSGAYLADVSQSPHRARGGAWIPTVARSSWLVSLSKRRVLTPDEIDLAMGWPAVELQGNGMYAAQLGFKSTFGMAKARTRKNLAGNGMMLPAVFSFFLYVAAHTVRKDQLHLIHMPINQVAPAGDSDDDLEPEEG